MRRDTQHMVLLLLGGALVQIAANGVFLRYVRPGQRWLLIAAGAVLVVLAVVLLVGDDRRARAATRALRSEGHAPDPPGPEPFGPNRLGPNRLGPNRLGPNRLGTDTWRSTVTCPGCCSCRCW